jgi:hypothetical protein
VKHQLLAATIAIYINLAISKLQTNSKTSTLESNHRYLHQSGDLQASKMQ